MELTRFKASVRNVDECGVMVKKEGMIFDIQRFSIHDGPGIRTLVFLKGCTLRCEWCSNPESQRFAPEIMFDPARCIGCRNCLTACPNDAVQQDGDRLRYLRKNCLACGRCAQTCYAEARVFKGQGMDVEEVVTEVLKDEPFYAESGGGVTLSGGEPLDQPDFAVSLLRRCKAVGVHTAVETAGNVPWSVFENVFPYTDLFLYDVKHLDPETLRRHTGADAACIRANLSKLSTREKQITIRTPVIPGFNDTADAILAIARFVHGLRLDTLHLLPYHRYGTGKYRALGRAYPFGGPENLSDERMEELKAIVEKEGLHVQVGG